MSRIINLKLGDEDKDIEAWWDGLAGNRADALRAAIRAFMAQEQQGEQPAAASAALMGEWFEWLARELAGNLAGLGDRMEQALAGQALGRAQVARIEGSASPSPSPEAGADEQGQPRLTEDELERRRKRMLKQTWG